MQDALKEMQKVLAVVKIPELAKDPEIGEGSKPGAFGAQGKSPDRASTPIKGKSSKEKESNVPSKRFLDIICWSQQPLRNPRPVYQRLRRQRAHHPRVDRRREVEFPTLPAPAHSKIP